MIGWVIVMGGTDGVDGSGGLDGCGCDRSGIALFCGL